MCKTNSLFPFFMESLYLHVIQFTYISCMMWKQISHFNFNNSEYDFIFSGYYEMTTIQPVEIFALRLQWYHMSCCARTFGSGPAPLLSGSCAKLFSAVYGLLDGLKWVKIWATAKIQTQTLATYKNTRWQNVKSNFLLMCNFILK